MTPTEINTYLARYVGWMHVNVGFNESWDVFQHAFQKAMNNDDYPTGEKIIYQKKIYEAFRDNDCQQAAEILVKFLKEQEK